jgi:hypothetical protein
LFPPASGSSEGIGEGEALINAAELAPFYRRRRPDALVALLISDRAKRVTTDLRPGWPTVVCVGDSPFPVETPF